MKKAAQATQDLFSKFLKEQLMDIVDKDKVKHPRCDNRVGVAPALCQLSFMSFGVTMACLSTESEALAAGGPGGGSAAEPQVRVWARLVSARHVLPRHHPVRGQLQPQVLRRQVSLVRGLGCLFRLFAAITCCVFEKRTASLRDGENQSKCCSV